MHVDDRVTSMVMNTIQSNRMPTDGGVQRGGRGAEEDILFRRCTYRTKKFYASFLGMETFRRKRLFDGVYEYVVISFQLTMEDEGRVGGRDLTIDVLS